MRGRLSDGSRSAVWQQRLGGLVIRIEQPTRATAIVAKQGRQEISVTSNPNRSIFYDGDKAFQNGSETGPSQYIMTPFRWPAALGGSEVLVIGSFNDWQEPFGLLGSKQTGDFMRTLPLLPGIYQYKYIVDGVWRTSPLDNVSADEKGQFNNQRLVAVSHVFRWKESWGGSEVFITGDFVEWAELLQLEHLKHDGEHQLKCCLQPGSYNYQFLVDSTWQTAPGASEGPDFDGHKCNKIEVSAPPAFYIYYSTGWKSAEIVYRHVGIPGGSQEWHTMSLMPTPSRDKPKGGRWLQAIVPLESQDVEGPQGQLEFYMREMGGSATDRPKGGQGMYTCPGPGGYKLNSGRLRPFPRALRAPFMLVSDLDGTMVDSSAEGETAQVKFMRYWETRASLVGSILVYNTGRSLGQFQHLWQSKGGGLALPDALITAVGTKVWLLDEDHQDRSRATGRRWKEDLQWARMLDYGWDLSKVRGIGDRICNEFELANYLDRGDEHPHRIVLSVHAGVLTAVINRLRTELDTQQVQAKIITSGQGDFRYLDCVAVRGGKLEALEYIRSMYAIAADRCVAAGDSGNDTLMLMGKNKGIVVGNAQEELLEWLVQQPDDLKNGRLLWTDGLYADGVLEGLAVMGLY